MTREEAEAALGAMGRRPEAEFVLWDAALLCAQHDDPARDCAGARAVAAEAADRLAGRLERQPCDEALADALCGDLDFAGDVLTYDDLANADMISVCQRRKGLPVALGVVFLTAARAWYEGDIARAERTAIRRALLDPADHRPWIDVASAREKLGAIAGAMDAFTRAAELGGGGAAAARDRLRLKLN
jgi:regulator of sirC expression with transglutaminase-like and TPR domain